MTGKKKAVIAVIAVLVVVAAIVIYNLPDISAWMEKNSAPSEDFVEFFTGFYEEPDRCSVLDENGMDVTDEFYDATVGFYEDGDFKSIIDYMWDNGIIEASCAGESLQDI